MPFSREKSLLGAILLAASLMGGPALADSIQVTRHGPHGGEFNRNTTCAGGASFGGCRTAWSYTGPQGRSLSGERGTAYGPRRTVHHRSVTGPAGRTLHRGGYWRRW